MVFVVLIMVCMCVSTQAEIEWKNMEDKQRYLRLQLLLDKSNIYCQFLLEKMERQKLEARKEQEKRAHQLQRKQNKEKDLMQMVIIILFDHVAFELIFVRLKSHYIILGTSLGTKMSCNILRFQELTFSTGSWQDSGLACLEICDQYSHICDLT